MNYANTCPYADAEKAARKPRRMASPRSTTTDAIGREKIMKVLIGIAAIPFATSAFAQTAPRLGGNKLATWKRRNRMECKEAAN